MDTIIKRIKTLAVRYSTARDFKAELKKHLSGGRTVNPDAETTLLRLLEFDGREVFELSEERSIRIRTMTLLWQFLRGECREEVSRHYLSDIRRQFERLGRKEGPRPGAGTVLSWMKRWPEGSDPRVASIRESNKKRIIGYLAERIERRRNPGGRYVFAENLSAAQKRRQVEEWWNEARFHLTMAIRSPRELNHALGHSLPKETLEVYREAVKKGIPVFVTPYYLSLLNVGDGGCDDAAVRSYVLYSKELVEAFGNIHAWEREDRVEPGKPNAAGWLLPEGGNIHRRYPDVVILIPDSVGRACGGLCASCQRMYDVQSGRLNFNFSELRPKESWNSKLRRLLAYIEEDKQIRDILITGGDALMSQDATLKNILDAVCRMALRKKKANLERPEGEKYAEIERVRLGTRLPVYLPMRITEDLVGILRDFQRKGTDAGIRQFFIQTHFQSPLELTPEARKAIRMLQSAGWIVTNQHVFNVAASRRGHAAKLRQCLNDVGVLCYYTFTVKGFAENHAVFVPDSRSLQERMEEKILGKMDCRSEMQLSRALQEGGSPGCVRQFLRTRHLPFVASDRNVLNLPGIGKSMTFRLVGILPDGRRLLEFDHDRTRLHSPVIERYPEVFILENKSVGEYLEQLASMGEDPREYESIWDYTEGETERRFPLFEYARSGQERQAPDHS